MQVTKKYNVNYYDHKTGTITVRAVNKTYVRKKYISDSDKENMKKMLLEGYNKYEICAKYNISMPTLNKYLR